MLYQVIDTGNNSAMNNNWHQKVILKNRCCGGKEQSPTQENIVNKQLQFGEGSNFTASRL